MITKESITKATNFLNVVNQELRQHPGKKIDIPTISKQYNIDNRLIYLATQLKYFSKTPMGLVSNHERIDPIDTRNIIEYRSKIIKAEQAKKRQREAAKQRRINFNVQKPNPKKQRVVSILWGLIKFNY